VHLAALVVRHGLAQLSRLPIEHGREAVDNGAGAGVVHLGQHHLNRLHELVVTPDNTFVQKWEYGDFIIFDNMGVIHDRTPVTITDDNDTERRFWRANVKHAWQIDTKASMDDIELHYDRTLAFCPAYTFIMVNYPQMLVDKQTYPRLEFNNNSQVVYAVDQDLGKVVGATVFYMLEDLSGHTCHTSVHTDYRGRGIASKMFAMVEDILRKKGAKSISTGAWMNNGEMKRVLEKTGRKVVVARGTKLLGPQYD
jgi:ribosomal protein S18 acetylase RimI-like enzyme